jgi:hypothetical protein
LKKLLNERLHNFHASPNIIRMMNSKRMRWAWNAALMGREGMLIAFWRERKKERDH